jgi:hypothetical protein
VIEGTSFFFSFLFLRNCFLWLSIV